MRGVRLRLLAAVCCAMFAGACSLVTSFDGFSGGPSDERDSGPGATDTGGPTKDAAGSDSSPSDAQISSDAPILNPSCKNDLSNIGTADFTISMNLSTTQTGTVAVVNQRMVCNGSAFWDVHLQDGDVQAETDDGIAHHATLNTTGPAVNDGNPHSVVVQRRSKVLAVFVDGAPAGMTLSQSAFGPLPALETRTSPCVGHTGVFAFLGPLANICATSP
jgi:hypothetical protein